MFIPICLIALPSVGIGVWIGWHARKEHERQAERERLENWRRNLH